MEEAKSPPSTGKSQSYSMPDIYTPAPRNEADDDNDVDEMGEDIDPLNGPPPPVTPKRRMTVKPKKITGS